MSSLPESASADREAIELSINGESCAVAGAPLDRLSDVLRRSGFIGTKVGCDAGDCGACSVLIDGEVACSCLVAVAQVQGARIETVENLASDDIGASLQQSFLNHGAAQCGICTPGMLVSATALLRSNPQPDDNAIEQALGGVLCRCTGYRKIIDAVREAHNVNSAPPNPVTPIAGAAIGAPVRRLDGTPKVTGVDRFGADVIPADALRLKVIRSPYHCAEFTIGDTDAWLREHAGLTHVIHSEHVPGVNRFGVIPPFADQPVFAERVARFRGEAVAAVIGSAQAIAALKADDFPIEWHELNAALTPQAALQADAMQLHEQRPGNILVEGLVQRGDVTAVSEFTEQSAVTTPFIEHGYIEPEAGFATRVGDRLELHTCTQSAGMVKDDIAAILGVADDQVRVLPTSVGGGFGSKLDLSIQPCLAVAAWVLNITVGGVYTRTESMQSSTKRHPASMQVSVGCDCKGMINTVNFEGTFNTGAYASWGPTVANRVPVHASGPYYVPNYRAHSVAVHTNTTPSGAFRGFGVPQAAIALETTLDRLADNVGIDRLQFRLNNALRNGQPTVTGQVFEQGVGIAACLEALQPAWLAAGERIESSQQQSHLHSHLRRGRGLGTCWYGCGNTSLPNPSTIKIGVDKRGVVVLHQGAIDIGQGSNTVIAQIAADALGANIDAIELRGADTDITPDAGKTSASRQTFVTGNAAKLAGASLRAMILREVNASAESVLRFNSGVIEIDDGAETHRLDLQSRPDDEHGYVFTAIERYDPPASALDENGQGNPYGQYGYGAQLMELTVDTKLGTVTLDRLTTAHDVGRAINPQLIEGQIEGGATQGIGMALMEEFIPGVAENLHDYLIPTFGDIPAFEHHIVEVPDAEGPFGAKGLGEHVLIPTAPAILNAIRDATGAVVTELPATPDRVLAALSRV